MRIFKFFYLFLIPFFQLLFAFLPWQNKGYPTIKKAQVTLKMTKIPCGHYRKDQLAAKRIICHDNK